MSVGIGFDLHRLVKGRKLLLGGVEIKHSRGLAGHSDADIVLHALIDAILGASGQGDIGEYFPDHDARFKGISSELMLKKVLKMISSKWRIVNADINIILESPKLGAWKLQIKKNIQRLLGVKSVNVKAKTMEGLGFIGKGNAIMSQAVVELVRR